MKDLNISDVLLNGDEMEKICEIESSSINEGDKNELIKMQLLSLIMRHSTIAKRYISKKPVYAKGEQYINHILKIVGELLVHDLKMYQLYGATYKMIVSILNANPIVIDQIEQSGDNNIPFDKLIIKYGLADKNYPEIKEAIKRYNAEREGV